MYSDSLFQFHIQAAAQEKEEYESVLPFDKYQLRHSKSSRMDCANLNGRELLIYGCCVDVYDEAGKAVAAEYILSKTTSLADVLSYEERLGGKYILFYKDTSGSYAIPDATASIPFCYTTEGYPLACATNSEMIAQSLSLQPNDELVAIRKSSDLSQAMPYNLTIYKEIEQLLPNHYFSFSAQKAVRFVNHKECKTEITAKEAAEQTAPLVKNILKLYKQNFELQCPITSGWDSRVVLSTMLSLGEQVKAYTIKHDNFSDSNPDIVIPKKISEKFSITYTQISDLEPDDQICAEFDKRFGASSYSKRTLMIANTVKDFCGDSAIINGDIIGQVGKCSLHRDIPAQFATARYFRCKLHNYSKGAVKYLKRWLDDIKESGEKVNLFDLFSVESRMGRWAAQENLIYAMVGQVYLNIFNSRAIIYPWTRVPRKDRKLSEIHRELIALIYPELIQIPVGGKASVAEKLTKMNGLTYYLASFLKFYVEKIRFLLKERKGRE